MGPRFCKRGNVLALAVLVERLWASMGPRFCKRGNLHVGGVLVPAGARFNGATLL